MSRSYADRSITLHERIAHVSIERFARSPRCPDDHRFHARSSLQLVVSWLAVFAEHDSRGVFVDEELQMVFVNAASVDGDQTVVAHGGSYVLKEGFSALVIDIRPR